MHENKAPFASADSATTTTGVAIDINVVTNDSDADGAINPAAVRIVSQPASGVAQVDATTGIVRYTSNATFSGADQFSYVVADNQRPRINSRHGERNRQCRTDHSTNHVGTHSDHIGWIFERRRSD